MAQEEGRFNFDDICAAISDKLERRHPHVFADVSASNSTGCLPVGSKSKPKNVLRRHSIPRSTIFP
jgi:ATP diphosphatase